MGSNKALEEAGIIGCARFGLLKAQSASLANSGFEHMPISMSPYALEKDVYNEGIHVAPRISSLLHAVASDHTLLQTLLGSAAVSDSFTHGLWWVMQEAENSYSSGIDLGIHRVDFMHDHLLQRLLMVEANTIAASFAGIGPLVAAVQSEVASYFDHALPGSLPDNPAAEGVAEALSDAWRAYGDGSARVLVVTQSTERNLLDQHVLTSKLFKLHGVKCERWTLTGLADHASLDDSGQLYINGSLFSVVYFRAGYSPNDFPSDKEWEARRLLEVSRAVKCPTAALHLAGTKKVQQQLAQPGMLQRLEPESASALQRCFAGQYTFDGDDGESVRQMAFENPNSYVLKPQREGGGNNLYGEDLKATVAHAGNASELEGYVLMDRIRPKPFESPMLRQGQLEHVQAVAELGLFTVHLSHGQKTQRSHCIGSLVRSKDEHADEGGVMAGSGVLDAVALTDA